MAYKGFKGIGPNKYGSPLKQDPNNRKKVGSKTLPESSPGPKREPKRAPKIVGAKAEKVTKRKDVISVKDQGLEATKEGMVKKEVKPLAAETVKVNMLDVKTQGPKQDTPPTSKYDEKLGKYEAKKARQHDKRINVAEEKEKKQRERFLKKAEKTDYKEKKKVIKEKYSF